jgi:LAO/AO transport system kinase
VNALVESARHGSLRAASRLISRIEDDPGRAFEVLAQLENSPAPRLVVGVIGAPGAGKSQLINALIGVWRRRQPQRRVGVLAVDPSSPRSGGAVLGDRIRMMEHCGDEQVFIRSLANRGRLGGLTFGIRGSVRVMGLAGCDVVLLETVGVGQNEVDVAQAADLVVVVLAPGLGDSVQLLKSGLLEIADVVVVNKADCPGAERLFAELENMLAGSDASERPPAFLVDSLRRRGVDELVDAIERRAAERTTARRRQSLELEIVDAVRESAHGLIDQAVAHGLPGDDAIHRVKSGQATVEQLAAELLEAAAAQGAGQGSLSTFA